MVAPEIDIVMQNKTARKYIHDLKLRYTILILFVTHRPGGLQRVIIYMAIGLKGDAHS